MSGNWVQQADCAIADKWVRTRMALQGGVDLVLELPSIWALSSAESFAWGAVSILESCGVVDTISFGSECGQVEPLLQIARCLSGGEYEQELRQALQSGDPFAVARQKAAERLLGETGSLLGQPNNNLGVSYLCALEKLGSAIRPVTVQRLGAAHNSEMEQGEHLSATRLRSFIRDGKINCTAAYVKEENFPLLPQTTAQVPSMLRAERAALARFRDMDEAAWSRIPDSGAAQGLARRLERAGRAARSLEEFYDLAAAKQYTRARIRRLALWAFLGLESDDIPTQPPYIRVLGCTAKGRMLLRQMGEKAALPILTKPAHVKFLSADGRKLFALESRCTDLFDLCMENMPAPGREWTTSPVILGEQNA